MLSKFFSNSITSDHLVANWGIQIWNLAVLIAKGGRYYVRYQKEPLGNLIGAALMHIARSAHDKRVLI